jgi:glycerophosphoryl diester phosphodiesterase
VSARTLIIGHRGAAGIAPENSLTGFRRAIELGADGVEFDVHLSADGVPMVIHDASLERTTDGTGPVSGQKAHDLRAVTLRGGGGTLPTLHDVARLLAPTALVLNIEIKTAARGWRYTGIEAAVAHVLDETGTLSRAVVTSFEWDCVGDFIALARPRLCLGLLNRRGVTLAGGIARALRRARARNFGGLCVAADAVSRRLKPADREAIWVYAANDAAALRRVFDSGVGAVITDRPDLASGLRDALAQ